MTKAQNERQRVRGVIQSAGVAILVTTDEGSGHVGRPMLPLLLKNDPQIYFLTHQNSRKVTQVIAQPEVVLTIAASDCYIVVTGRADVLHDRAIVRRLWHPTYRAWFPEGKDDREAVVLRVGVERVDYWEPPRIRLVRLGQAVRAVLMRRGIETPMKTLDGL